MRGAVIGGSDGAIAPSTGIQIGRYITLVSKRTSVRGPLRTRRFGYHGAKKEESIEFLRGLLDGRNRVEDWRPSRNTYDWLGHGVYFWEHSPERARRWAGEDGFVIGAVIQLGRCLDLTDIRYTGLLRGAYDLLKSVYDEEEKELPRNTGQDFAARNLDCLVINHLIDTAEEDESVEGVEFAYRFQTVRCPFEEGDSAFPGSMIRQQNHVQIAVRDPSCILGVFRPTA